MPTQSAGSASSVCFVAPSIASIHSCDGQCGPLIELSQRGGAWARGVARFRAALMIKLGSARWMTSAAVVALTLIAGSAVSRAQSCPTSFSYSPDFASNSCLALNGNASISGSLLQITPDSNRATRVCLVHHRGARCRFLFHHLHISAARGFCRWLRVFDPKFVCRNKRARPGRLRDGIRRRSSRWKCLLCGGETGGIPNSVAIGFKTYNGDGSEYPQGNSVFIANNGTGPNCENVQGGEYGYSQYCVIARKHSDEHKH